MPNSDWISMGSDGAGPSLLMKKDGICWVRKYQTGIEVVYANGGRGFLPCVDCDVATRTMDALCKILST